jgi:hypothetical protein
MGRAGGLGGPGKKGDGCESSDCLSQLRPALNLLRRWRLRGSRREAQSKGRVVYEVLGGDLPAWDQGRLDAHQISAGPTEVIERCLFQAKQRRRRPLAWFWPGRRRYLDGLIRGLEDALAMRRRSRSRQVGPKGGPDPPKASEGSLSAP